MNIVYESALVDLKIVQTESNSNVFYQVWKDGIICKQSESYEHCKTYAFDLVNEMVETKLQALESDVYWTGQSYLHCTEDHSYQRANDYTQAQLALKRFKDLIQ